jgi:GNAT superfamily N-acetyltransferase
MTTSKIFHVRLATEADILAWRVLAAEVEPLFGPMVGVPAFEEALVRKIRRGQALCACSNGSAAPLLGGLLWSAHPPRYRIGWLAVASHARRHGVGGALVQTALAWATPLAEVEVVTFGADVVGGDAARRFYERFGFAPAEAAPDGPEGGSRQVYRYHRGSL